MITLEYVKNHIDEFEEDDFLDRRWTKRFIDFIPTNEWERYGFKYTGEGKRKPKEWTEANIIEQLKEDVDFGFEKAVGERGISAELMAMVVNAWCKVLENGLNLDGDVVDLIVVAFIKIKFIRKNSLGEKKDECVCGCVGVMYLYLLL